MRIVIIGAGALGGLVGAQLTRGGEDVTLIEINEARVKELRKSGLFVSEGTKDEVRVEFETSLNEQFHLRTGAVSAHTHVEHFVAPGTQRLFQLAGNGVVDLADVNGGGIGFGASAYGDVTSGGVEIDNSTISGNRAGSSGGGIANLGWVYGGGAVVTNSTISRNSAGSRSEDCECAGFAGRPGRFRPRPCHARPGVRPRGSRASP